MLDEVGQKRLVRNVLTKILSQWPGRPLQAKESVIHTVSFKRISVVTSIPLDLYLFNKYLTSTYNMAGIVPGA